MIVSPEIAKDLGVSHNITEALDEVYVNISNGASAHYAASRGEYLNAVLISPVSRLGDD